MAQDPHEAEQTAAFEWLMEDPNGRAIESPTRLDAVFNLYAARELFPDFPFTFGQFTWKRLPAAVGTDSRILPLHYWTS